MQNWCSRWEWDDIDFTEALGEKLSAGCLHLLSVNLEKRETCHIEQKSICGQEHEWRINPS